MKSCSGEQKRGERKTAKFRTKLVVPESKISQCEENYLRLKKILEKYSVKIYEIDSYFYKHYEKKDKS